MLFLIALKKIKQADPTGARTFPVLCVMGKMQRDSPVGRSRGERMHSVQNQLVSFDTRIWTEILLRASLVDWKERSISGCFILLRPTTQAAPLRLVVRRSTCIRRSLADLETGGHPLTRGCRDIWDQVPAS